MLGFLKFLFPASKGKSAALPEPAPLKDPIDKSIESYLDARQSFLTEVMRGKAVIYQTLFSYLYYAERHIGRDGNTADNFGDFNHWLMYNRAEPNIAAGVPRFHENASISAFSEMPNRERLSEVVKHFVLRSRYSAINDRKKQILEAVNGDVSELERRIKLVVDKKYPSGVPADVDYDTHMQYLMGSDLRAMKYQTIRISSHYSHDTSLHPEEFKSPKELAEVCRQVKETAERWSGADKDITDFIQQEWNIPSAQRIESAIHSTNDDEMDKLVNEQVESLVLLLEEINPAMNSFYARIQTERLKASEQRISWRKECVSNLIEKGDLQTAARHLGNMVTATSLPNRSNHFRLRVSHEYGSGHGFSGNLMVASGENEEAILAYARSIITGLSGIANITPTASIDGKKTHFFDVEVNTGSKAGELLSNIEGSLIENKTRWVKDGVKEFSDSWHRRSDENVRNDVERKLLTHNKRRSIVDFDPNRIAQDFIKETWGDSEKEATGKGRAA